MTRPVAEAVARPGLATLALALAAGALLGGLVALGQGWLGLAALAGVVVLAVLFTHFELALAFFFGVFLIVQQAVEGLGLGSARYADEVAILVLLAVLGLKRLARGGVWWRLTTIDGWLAGFAALGVLSAALNGVPAEIAARGLFATLKGALAFYVAWNLEIAPRRLRRFVDWLIVAAAAVVVLGLIEWLIGPAAFYGRLGLQAFIPQAGAKWGMSAIFNHPAHAAYFVGIMASFAVADLVVQPARADRPLRLQLALLALLGAGLLITNTRAAWLGMLVSIVLVLWLEARTMRARRIATGLLAGLSAAGALLLATYRPLWESFSGKLASYALGVERYILGTYLWNQGIDYRFFAFFAGLQVFADHVVFGVGPGRFGGWVAYEFPSPVYQEYAIPFLGGVLAQSDNFWIHLLAESGLAGFLLFAAALVVLYRGCRRLYHDHPDVEVRRLALGAMLSFVFVVVVGFFAPILEGPPAPYYFWGLAGALLGGAALRAKRP